MLLQQPRERETENASRRKTQGPGGTRASNTIHMPHLSAEASSGGGLCARARAVVTLLATVYMCGISCKRAHVLARAFVFIILREMSMCAQTDTQTCVWVSMRLVGVGVGDKMLSRWRRCRRLPSSMRESSRQTSKVRTHRHNRNIDDARDGNERIGGGDCFTKK